MLENYFVTALRNLLGSKLFSCINVSGLAVGLASAILIGLFVVDELGYDRFHPAYDRIYRLGRDLYPREDFEGVYLATLPVIAAEQLRQDYPQLEAVVRASPGRGLLARDDRMFHEDALLYADPALLDLFHFEFIAGDPVTALSRPDSIVLTESLARRYFGDEPALGQSMVYENRSEISITGVIRDLPANTHLRADALRPMTALLNALPENMRGSSWNSNIMHTYVRLPPSVDIATLVATFPAFIDRHVQTRAAGTRASRSTGITAMKVSDIHLRSTRQNEMRVPGSMSTVLALVAVASGIVLIACFNFMNLATARSLLRGKEVGIRKTIGAERRHLVLQFLGESLGMVLLAMLAAVVLVEVALPAFNGFVGKSLVFDVLGNWRLQIALGVLVSVVGIGAGFYPALYLSAFKPAQVLQRPGGSSLREISLRNLLVVLQFSISIALVVATVVIDLQMRYVRDFDPGFDKEQVVVLNGSPSAGLTERWPALRQELLNHPGVASVTASNLVPGAENLIGIRARSQGAPESENADFSTLIMDYDFFETYRVDLLAGRLFNADFAADVMAATGQNRMTANFVLNASAARVFGWAPEEAVGQLIRTGTEDSTTIGGRVIGVVADSNFESLRFSVPPMLFLLGQQGGQTTATFSAASIRLTGDDIAGTLEHIDRAWKRVIPEFPGTRRFLSEDFDALYQNDSRLGQMFSSFATLAIIIACLGLFGLATFNAQRRIKEIGIRKVMGSSVWSIMLLLTSDFSRLVLISNVIAWPVAYFAMERWLENFAHRIGLTPLVFIGSGLIALCIAWVTVGGTAAKAASTKPVLALRYE